MNVSSRLLLCACVLPLLVGCATKEYYNRQPDRDYAEVQRVKQAADGYKAIAEAVFSAEKNSLPAFSLPRDGSPVQSGDRGDEEAVEFLREEAPAPSGAYDAASTLLKYIASQQAAAEKTKQVQAIVAGYTQAVLKKQHEQQAPFDPTVLGTEAVRQAPLGLAVWALKSLGTSGVAAARGDVTTNVETSTVTETDGAGE